MRAEIKELTGVICDTEGVYERESLVQEFHRCQTEWDHAESMFQIAFHGAMIDNIVDSPITAHGDLIEAFKKLETCCQRWQSTLKTI